MRRLSWKYRGLVVAGLVLGLALPAQAAEVGLAGRLEATPGGTDYQAYYDPHQDITWAADANLAQTSGFDGDGKIIWSDANAWAAGLTIGGVSGWRLPTALNQDGTGPCSGSNCTGSEMGYLFYTELGNTSGSLTDTGPFSNVQPHFYWSGDIAGASSAWGFNFNNGLQGEAPKNFIDFAWAVRSGDVAAPAPIPEPGTLLLMGSGLVGLLAWRRLWRG